jgi:GH18 family chitinase
MRKIAVLTCLCLFSNLLLFAQSRMPAGEYPVRSMCISAPTPGNVDSFVVFINTVLAPRQINQLILRVDYRYQYKSHPELIGEEPLSLADVHKLRDACRAHDIKVIPQINLLGHQSWAGDLEKLLEVYPQFDETPWIKMPENYKWPNADSLYCKSYCPLHPDVHKIVFELVDELCDAFGTDAFHAGMDEVFYIGMDKCPRCSGKDKSELFANEVNKIRDHLAKSNRTLYIWGDRMLDGFTTGIGGWEASFNDTWRSIDMIKKDVVICDWHYERPDKTAPYFAAKGFRVITCTWNRPLVAIEQEKDMQKFYAESTPEMKTRFLGMMQTVWSPVSPFLKDYYSKESDTARTIRSQAGAFKAAFKEKAATQIIDTSRKFAVVAYVMCNTPDAISRIDFKSITHIHFAFVNPDSTGRFAYNGCLDSVVKLAHANGVKVMASIGGGSAPEYYEKLLEDKYRGKLVTNLTQLAIDYKLDGIDVDLEGSRIDKNYEKLVSELADALHPINKELSAAIATVYKDRLTDKALNEFDYLTIMSYDKTGPWRPEVAGHHSPYSMAVEDVEYWTRARKLDPKKVYLGVPFYGYSFGKSGASSMSYNDIVNTFPGSEKKDELKMPDGSTLYYNGIPTIKKKVKLAMKSAGGVMFWQLMGDTQGDKSLLKAINETAYPSAKSEVTGKK